MSLQEQFAEDVALAILGWVGARDMGGFDRLNRVLGGSLTDSPSYEVHFEDVQCM